jgi:hypothetical protein
MLYQLSYASPNSVFLLSVSPATERAAVLAQSAPQS